MTWGFPGGESFTQQRERVLAGLADWRAREIPGNVVIVCHGNVIRLVTGDVGTGDAGATRQREHRRAVTRLSQVVFGVLVASAFAAFFVAQQLKTSPSVVQSFKVKYPVISPNGDGRLDRQRVTFRLKRADTVDVAVVNSQGDVVRELASGHHLDAYRQLLPSLAWDGTDDVRPPGARRRLPDQDHAPRRGAQRDRAEGVPRRPHAAGAADPLDRPGPAARTGTAAAPGRRARADPPLRTRPAPGSCASSACGPARRSRTRRSGSPTARRR